MVQKSVAPHASFLNAHKKWTEYFSGEKEYIKELSESFWGSRYASKRIYEAVRERARALNEYREWTEDDESRAAF